MKFHEKVGAFLFISIFALATFSFASAAILQGFQGGTGIGTTGAGNLGAFLKVASTSPFLTYTFGSSTGNVGPSTSTYVAVFNGLTTVAGDLNFTWNSSTHVLSFASGTTISTPDTASPSAIHITGGSSNGGNGNGGTVFITSGNGNGNGSGNKVELDGGTGGATNGTGGNITFNAGPGGGNGNGGDVSLNAGPLGGSGANGHVTITDPTGGFAAIFDTSALLSDQTFTFPSNTGTFCLTVTCVTNGNNPFTITAPFVYFTTSTYNLGIGASSSYKFFVQDTSAATNTVGIQGMALQTGDLLQVASSGGIKYFTISSLGLASSSEFRTPSSSLGAAVASGLTVTGVTNALGVLGAGGALSAYTGTSCSAANYPTGQSPTGTWTGCTAANAGTLTGNGTQNYIPFYNTATGFISIAGLNQNSTTGMFTAPSGTITGPFFLGSTLNVTSTSRFNGNVTVSSSFTQQGAVASLASTTINGQATTTSLSVTGISTALLLSAGSTGAVTAYGGASACSAGNAVTTISAVGGTTCAAFGSGSGTVTTSTALTATQIAFGTGDPNIGTSANFTITTSTGVLSAPSGTFTGNFLIGGTLNVTSTSRFNGNMVVSSSFTQQGAVASLASTTINGQATTTSLSVTGISTALLLSAGSTGAVTAYGGASACAAGNAVTTISAVGGTTCAAFGTGTGTVTTSTALTATRIAFGTGDPTIGASSNFTYNSTTFLMSVPSSTISGILQVTGVPAATTSTGQTNFGNTPQVLPNASGTYISGNTAVYNGDWIALQNNSSTVFRVASSGATTIGNSTTTFTFLTNGHITSTSTSNTPVLSSCGTTPSIVGSDAAGTVTVGSVAATGCTITFANAYVNAPACTVTEQTGSVTNVFSYTLSTTAIVVSQTGLTSDKLNYVCIGNE